MNGKYVYNSLRKLHKLKVEKDKAKKAYETLKAEIVTAMKAEGLSEIAAGDFSAKYAEFPKKALNQSRLKAEKPDIYEQFIEIQTGSRFTLK